MKKIAYRDLSALLLWGLSAAASGAGQPPDAVDDSADTDTNTAVDVPVLSNDSDLDGDPLSVIAVTDPANGSTSINPDDSVQYVPDAGYNGPDTFTYTISDGTDENEIGLTASQAAIDDRYGLAVDVSGDVGVIGASTDEGTSGVDVSYGYSQKQHRACLG